MPRLLPSRSTGARAILLASGLLLALTAAGCGGGGMTEEIPRLLLTEVVVSNFAIDQIEIQNLEAESIIASAWSVGSSGNYYNIPDDTMIRSEEVIVIVFTDGPDTGSMFYIGDRLGDPVTASGEVALFHDPEDFDDSDAMFDYVQWGAAGNDREAVADQANLWRSGEFVDMVGYPDGTHSLTRIAEESAPSSWIFDVISIGAVN